MSAFNPDLFLEATVTEASVKRPPLPIGDYVGIIGDVTAREWTGKTDPTKSGGALDVPVTIEVPAEVQAQMGVEVSTLRFKDSIMLDLLDNGSLDTSIGKNNHLRKYREALDMNKPGEPFSPKKMSGQVALFKIGHELYNDEIVERIKGVTRRA